MTAEHERASPSAHYDPAALDAVFSSPRVGEQLRATSPGGHAVACEFWKVPMATAYLEPRLKELVLLGMHASATSLNAQAIARQVQRVLRAGGTHAEILDVVITISSLANHALYGSVPVLEEELARRGGATAPNARWHASYESAKQRFKAIRGFWNSERDPVGRMLPEYSIALMGIATEMWEKGPLTTRERELVAIGIDCTVTHSFLPGLRTHIRGALDAGATREEILGVFQLAALLGLEGYILAAEAMFGATARERPLTADAMSITER